MSGVGATPPPREGGGLRSRDSYLVNAGIEGIGGAEASKLSGRLLNLVEYRRLTRSEV